MAQAGEPVRPAGRPGVRRETGAIGALRAAPPSGAVAADLDETGPESAEGFPGQALVGPRPAGGPDGRPRPAGRAEQEVDYGRRGRGSIFGALLPAAGAAPTRPYPGRGAADFADFAEHVDARIPAEVGRGYAVPDNRSARRATGVLLFAPAQRRREFAFQPVYAADLDPIEPRWEVLRSPALRGRRFATWEQVREAVERATADWNAHRHPFVRGRRRRHRPRRQPGIAAVPGVRSLAG